MNLKAARQKYLRLGREIDKYYSGNAWSNLHHTHSKLGIFLDAELGKAWREATKQSNFKSECCNEFVYYLPNHSNLYCEKCKKEQSINHTSVP